MIVDDGDDDADDGGYGGKRNIYSVHIFISTLLSEPFFSVIAISVRRQ